jgi:glutaryl-CoA dehydrogenase (non-decarboxylating)
MLDFSLSDEHRLLEQSIREWGARDVAPYIRDNDRKHHFDRERILGGMARLGLLGISVPQEYGGAGMDYIALGIASEELEYLDTSLRVIMSVHAGLNCLTLLGMGHRGAEAEIPRAAGAGHEDLRLRPDRAGAGSDARGIQTTATKKGDRYVLNGEKSWISLADVADHFLVIAWTDLEKKKQGDPSGMTAFIVERTLQGLLERADEGEVGHPRRQHRLLQDGRCRGARRRTCWASRAKGFKIAMFALDQGRFTVAAGATGLIRACRDASVKYAKERKTFGVEIGQHQLVKEMIAQMESDYQAARLLWLRSGWMKNNGQRNTRETGLAKWFATVASERAAGDAVQIHGANGYSDEYPVGRFYRNCKGAVIYEGTREIHKVMQGRLPARLPHRSADALRIARVQA